MSLSSAEELEQAREDTERIGRAMFEEVVRQSDGQVVGKWDELGSGVRRRWTSIATALLHSGVVKVGRRPEKGEPPMTGQGALDIDGLEEHLQVHRPMRHE